MLGGDECCLVLDGYDGDESPEEFHAAATNFLSIGEDVLKQAAPFVFAYYQDCVAARGAPATIAKPADVLRDVKFGERFVEIYTDDGDGRLTVDYGRLHETEPAAGIEGS